MKLKDCPCCKKPQTTKNALFIGAFKMRTDGLMFNCLSCHSSFVIMGNKILKKATPKVEKLTYEELEKLQGMAQDIVKRLA